MDFIILTIILFEIILGYVVYKKGARTKGNRAFVWITFCLVLWCIAIYMLWHSSKKRLLFWDNATYLGSSLLAAMFLTFVLNFPKEIKIPKILNRLIFLPVPIIWIFAFTYLITPAIVSPLDKAKGVGYYFFSIYFLSYMTIGFFVLYYNLKHCGAIERIRVLYVFVGSILSTISGTLCNLILPMIGNWNFIKLGPAISGLILVVSFSYAILKHHLFDIEVIIKKTLVFAGLFTFAFGVIVGVAMITQELLPQFLGISRLASLAISAIIIVFSLRPLENFLINITNKYLFQKKYNPRKILKDFADEALTILNLDKLCKITVDTLANNLYLTNCAVLLLGYEEIGYEIYDSFGIDRKGLYLNTESPIVKSFNNNKLPLLYESYDKSLQAQDDVKKDMDKMKSQVCLPLIIRNELVGMLSLGAKKSDQPYNADDVDILTTLTKALSIAISNARLFMQAAQNEKLATIGTITSAINHEVCGPLGRISAQIQLYLEDKKRNIFENEASKREFNEVEKIMQNIMQEIKKTVSITSKLSGFAKPSKVVESTAINIAQSIEDTLILLKHKLELDKINIEKNIPENLPKIIADEDQMQQVFFNLVKNANEAIKENGTITIAAKEEHGKVKIEIKDTGCGIPEDKLDEVFKPFYTTKGEGKGSGYGLAVVKELVQRNNGNILVKSKVGEGTTFILEFPKA